MGGFLVIRLIKGCVVFFSPICCFFSPETTDVMVVIMVGLEVCTQTKPAIRKQKGFSFQDL